MFRCPSCHTSLGQELPDEDQKCAVCGHVVSVLSGVPILLRNRAAIEERINAAKQERRSWYEEPHADQWQGPYRHHLKKRKAYIESTLRKYARSDDLVGLDLGCGDGGNYGWLNDKVGRLYGSDYNLTRAVRAKKYTSERRIYVADVLDYPTTHNAFDFILFNHVLEHIPDDMSALSEVHRILRPNGTLILGVPNEGAWFWRLAYRLQPQSRTTTDHVQFYTSDTLAEKCINAGFTLKESKQIGWGVPHWSLDARLRRRKWVDDALEIVGRTLFPSQATSLYLVLTK